MIPVPNFGWILLLFGIAALAMPLPIAFAMQSFGPHRWAARRALLASVVCSAAGYVAMFAYYSLYGLPDAVLRNPEAAQSAAGQAVLGALIVGGYGSLAAFIYFYFIRGDRRNERS